jgi:hypothetical protein
MERPAPDADVRVMLSEVVALRERDEALIRRGVAPGSSAAAMAQLPMGELTWL